MVHIADVFSETFSLIVEALSEIVSTPLGQIALLLTILYFVISIFRGMVNVIKIPIEVAEVSKPEPEPEPEVKEVPKPQIKKIVVKPVIKKPQFVICDYCGTKHKAEDKICETCNAVLPTEKE